MTVTRLASFPHGTSFRGVFIPLLAFLLTFTIQSSFAQSWRWAVAADGPGDQNIITVASDSAGNRYVGGNFTGTAHFGATTMVSLDSTSGFIAKLDSLGNWLWAKALTGPIEQNVKKVRMGRHGQLFFLGESDGTAEFDGQALPGGYYTFVISVESSSGRFQWITNPGNSGIADIAVDTAGKLFVCGTFGGDSLRLGSIRIANTCRWIARSDAYIGAISTSSGTWEWAVAGGGSGYQSGMLLDLDAQGNIYLAGRYVVHSYDDSTAFGSHVLPFYFNPLGDHLFLAKLNANRTWEWAMGTDNMDAIFLYSLFVQPNGVSYLDGFFHYGDLLLGDSPVVTVSTPLVSNGFIAAVSPGGRVMWGVNPATSYESVFTTVRGDHDGNLLVTGTVEGDTARLGGISLQIPPGGLQYVAALDTTGHWTWAMPVPGSSWFDFFCIGPKRRLTFGGSFRGPQTFGTFTLQNPTRTTDAFVAELSIPPIIQLFSPTVGPAGTVVMLTGNGFLGATAVLFGGVPATSFTVLSDGSIRVIVPAGVGQGVPIQVVGPTGTGQSVGRYGQLPQGLASDTKGRFELWPNPAHQSVVVMMAGSSATPIIVLNGLGQIVRQVMSSPTAPTKLNLTGLPAGIYVVRAGGGTRRLIVE
jgi:IPT/TIG domain/Secretion system C-terminal sorting domain